MIINKIYTAAIILVMLACGKESSSQNPPENEQLKNSKPSLAFLKKELNNPRSKYIMVVAHRGNWHAAPENSIEGIEKAIDLGVDMVEVDVRKTKDGKLVLMHDETVERTTNGKGKVADLTLAELKQLRLKMNSGQLTDTRIPTFEEAMAFAKDKVLINVDKAEGSYKEIGETLALTNTHDIALVKSYQGANAFKPFYDFVAKAPHMAVISLNASADPIVQIDAYHNQFQTPIIELSFGSDTYPVLSSTNLLLDKNIKLFYTPTSTKWTGGHHDTRAINGDQDGAWGWLVSRGGTIILSDYPKELIAYLQKRGHRNFKE